MHYLLTLSFILMKSVNSIRRIFFLLSGKVCSLTHKQMTVVFIVGKLH